MKGLTVRGRQFSRLWKIIVIIIGAFPVILNWILKKGPAKKIENEDDQWISYQRPEIDLIDPPWTKEKKDGKNWGKGCPCNAQEIKPIPDQPEDEEYREKEREKIEHHYQGNDVLHTVH